MLRPSTTSVRRNGAMVQVRASGQFSDRGIRLAEWESILGTLDAHSAAEVAGMKRLLQGWRFYAVLRIDAAAPARQDQIGTRTPVLDSNGSDLAAAIQTIFELSDPAAFNDAIAAAFNGAAIQIGNDSGRFSLRMQQPGLLRPLNAQELSDGTLRYILLAAALLSPRPAPLLVLNEPENSLHPQLLEPLARLVARAATDSQVVVSHSTELVGVLEPAGALRHELVKEQGETVLQDQGPFDRPARACPKR